MSSLIEFVRSPFGDRWRDRGATAVEYSIMLGCIAAVIITAVVAVGGQTLGLFTSATDAMAAHGIGGAAD